MTSIALVVDVPARSMCRTAAVLHSGALSLEDGSQRGTAGRVAVDGEADGDADGEAEAEADGGLLEDWDEEGEEGDDGDEELLIPDPEVHPVASVPTPSRRTVRRERSTSPA
jgi:hypothetical protein